MDKGGGSRSSRDVQALLSDFGKNPTDRGLFEQLSAALEDAKRYEDLAQVSEVRAAHVQEQDHASVIWCTAGAARLQAGQLDFAEQNLREAVALLPSNEVAANCLFDVLCHQERHAEAAQVLETFLDALAELAAEEALHEDPDALAQQAEDAATSADQRSRERADGHEKVAEIFEDKLGRLDRALHHYQRAWQLSPDRTEAIDRARAIYMSLDNTSMAMQLIMAELGAMVPQGQDRPERRAALELAVGKILIRRGDHSAALEHLEIAHRLDPESIPVRLALAEAHNAEPLADSDEHRGQASEMHLSIGEHYLNAGEEELAIQHLRRALNADPYSATALDKLEEALRPRGRWEEIDRLYRHRLSLARTDDTRINLLGRLAEIYENDIDDREALKGALEELAGLHGPDSEHSLRLREMYREDQDWEDLAALIEVEAQTFQDDRDRFVGELMELAKLLRDQLGEQDRAAEILHRVLSIDPCHEEATERYGNHFRERRDWYGLADLIEFTVDSQEERGAGKDELIIQLEELAHVAESRLGDVDRAVAAWRRIEDLEPQNEKASEALRRLISRAKMWEQLVMVLEQEAETAKDPQAKAEALRRIAQVYRERQVHPRRAIALYEQVLTLCPQDEGTLTALAELYERSGDDAGLAHTIRRQQELEVVRMRATIPGGPTAWPVPKRVERLTSLRQLASMYEDKLADLEGVVFACGAILEMVPGDKEALERMERVLEKAGDVPRLEETLEYHAAAASGPAEKSKVLRRLASLASARGDTESAIGRWEEVLAVAPNDREALLALADLYETKSEWKQVAQTLERLLAVWSHTSADEVEYLTRKRQYAAVVDTHLSDSRAATSAWTSVLEVAPSDTGALQALARLHRSAERWADLTQTLERLIPLVRLQHTEAATSIAMERSELLVTQLGQTGEAIRCLEKIVTDIDPSNVTAHQRLRSLYEGCERFDAAIRIAERELVLEQDPGTKLELGIHIGNLCRNELKDPNRALQAFERVLVISPDHVEALKNAADLYEVARNWERHTHCLMRLLQLRTRADDKRDLMQRIGRALADKRNSPEEGFDWLRRAHETLPSEASWEELCEAAHRHERWHDLSLAYDAECQRLVEGGPTTAATVRRLSLELAELCETHLDDPLAALDALARALQQSPDDSALVTRAEEVAENAGTPQAWRRLLDCFEAVSSLVSGATLSDLHIRRAELQEQKLEDPEAAVEELLRAFAWAPKNDDIRRRLRVLAETTDSFNAVLSVESALAECEKGSERIAALRRKATLLEEHVGDSVRAFRTLLRAFLLEPTNEEIVGNLWRLATDIGSYSDANRVPQPEPPAAFIAKGAAPRETAAPRAQTPRAQTQPLTTGDLLELRTEGRGSTERLETSDLLEVVAKRDNEREPTMELRTQDLLSVLSQGRRPGPPPMPGVAQRERSKGLPPPAPRPTIRKLAPDETGPIRRDVAGPAGLPARPYETPWEEFVTAYRALPGARSERLQHLYAAAELWETGAKLPERAFSVLAEAFDLDTQNDATRKKLHELAAEHRLWSLLADLYRNSADRSGSAEASTIFLREAADVLVTKGAHEEAEPLYRRALGISPTDHGVREKLEELYRVQERWVDLAAALEERTDPRLGSAAPSAVRASLLRELATVYHQRLDRARDAADALERLVEIEPEDRDALELLSDLYAGNGQWRNVISALSRIAVVAEGTDRERQAQRVIGRIYERELKLPERAIEAYAQITRRWPDDEDAFAALDKLYSNLARHKELAEVLGRRVELATEDETRGELAQRRAVLLLEIGSPEEAVSALKHAQIATPKDPRIAPKLARALVDANRIREACVLLEQAVEGGIQAGAPAGDTASRLVQLAELKIDHLGDPSGAKETLDRALELVPGYPSAMAALSRLAQKHQSPRDYADAKLREADASEHRDTQVEALLEAARALHERCDDSEGAKTALQKILELKPYHPEATWELSQLLELRGATDEAARILEARLSDESLSQEERANLLTRLANLSEDSDTDAEQRLDDALDAAPTHAPAILARAALLERRGQDAELMTFLEGAISELDDDQSDVRAELERRLALAAERNGDHDRAYQLLLAADRRDRNNLLIKHALGENRFRERRWREAALHLSALADHPDSEDHAELVAEALCHAAQAESRALRPQRATPLYEKALELCPTSTPALHALAEVALATGQVHRGVELSLREAEHTRDRDEQRRLFEAVGDLASGHELWATAHEALAAALELAHPIDAGDLLLVEKLLAAQEEIGNREQAGKSCELLASFATASDERAGYFKRAAEHFLAAGCADQAKNVAKHALSFDPHDLTAANIASELLLEEGDVEEVASLLGRTLSRRDELNEITRTRQSMLWSRLGEARLKRGDQQGARVAYESALELSPDCDGAILARRRLIEIVQTNEDTVDTLLGYRRYLAGETRDIRDIVDHGRALADAGRFDEASAVLDMACALGHAPDDDDRRVLNEHSRKRMADDERYASVIDRAKLDADLGEHGATDSLLSALWEAAPLLWTSAQEALTAHGLEDAVRIQSTTEIGAATMFTRIAQALDAPATVLYRHDREDGPDVQVICASPAIVVLGPRLCNKRQGTSESERRFLLARAAFLCHRHRLLAEGLPSDELLHIAERLGRIFGPDRAVLQAGDNDFKTVMPMRVRTRLSDCLANRPAIDAAAWRAHISQMADCVGLLFGGNFRDAERLSAGGDSDHLVGWILGPSHAELRLQLGK